MSPSDTPPRRDLNRPQTVATARKKIAQLHDAHWRSDLDRMEAVASGWLAALCVEALVDRATFDELMAELAATHQAVREALPSE